MPPSCNDMRRLTLGDLPSIVAVETNSFVPGARVTEACLRKRLELGHLMIGAEERGQLVGLVAFLYSDFDPADRQSFPNTQAELSTQPTREGANTGFIYNLAITPGNRKLALARNLYRMAAQAIVEAGCTYIVGAVRVPSYRGSQGYPQENIPASPELAQAIDRYRAGGAFPSPAEFRRDPLVAFHQRMTAGSFLWIQEDFEPDDHASGSMSVVIYGQAGDILAHLNAGRTQDD